MQGLPRISGPWRARGSRAESIEGRESDLPDREPPSLHPSGITARLLLPLLALFGAAQLAVADVAVPARRQPVTDLTATLSAAQQQELTRRIEALEARKGSQIAVVLLPTTGAEPIESYALRVGEAWELGRQGVDDGVVFVVAKNDRAMRLDVGYGLEGAIPDAIAKRIISEVVTPYFKRGDIPGGVAAGVDRLIATIEGEPLPAPPPSTSGTMGGAIDKIPLVIVAVAVFGTVLRAMLGRLLATLFCGGVVGVVVWMALHSIPAALIAGMIAGVLVGVSDSSSRRARRYGRRGFGSTGGFFPMGGGGGFRSSRGGGFSGGGGGRFGGGGASGRW